MRQAQEPALPKTGPVFKDSPGFRARDLIARAGLGGKTIGNAQITEQNANYIANLGGATAQEILSLIIMAHQQVLTQFGIDLLLNLELLGEWPVSSISSRGEKILKHLSSSTEEG